jgi:uncharacterized sulfatase
VQYSNTQLKATFILLLMTSCTVFSAPKSQVSADTSHPDAAQQPNIIVILTDDQGWGDIGLNGATLFKTPNIDQMGKQGVQLTQFYAASNVCTPSRAGLLTGRYAIRSGMQHVVFPHHDWGLPSQEITVAEMLSSAGYRTGMIGKWHLGHHKEYWPTEHGFDRFLGVAYSNDMKPFDLYDGTNVIEKGVNQKNITDRFTVAAQDFINDPSESPFFLYLAHVMPHLPLFVPDEVAGTSGGGLYGDVIERIDWSVGEILKTLKNKGIDRNTLVIFTSDNGPWFEGSAGPYRNRKGGTYDGSYRVPFVAQWPAKIKPGTKSNGMSMAIDLLPTFAALSAADIPTDRTIDGRNISSLLQGENKSPHEALLFMNGNDIAAVRTQRFKLVLNDYYREYYVPFEQFGASLLFDLEKDPKETVSYLREYPNEAQTLKTIVEKYRKEFESLSFPAPSARPDENSLPPGPMLNNPEPVKE